MSLVVQWLRLCASNAGGTGSIPGHGTKTPPPPQKKKRFPGWALIPYDWCPFKKRVSGQRGKTMCWQGGDSRSRAKERGLEQMLPSLVGRN